MRKYLKWLCLFSFFLIFLFSFWLRIAGLDHLPGINGDEAWYGVQVKKILGGDLGFLRTPTGLPLNPFYAVPLAIGELIVPQPSFLALRIPSLISGLLLIVLSFFLMKDVCGLPRAMAFSLLVAALPAHIAYSRFGWDSSQTPLAALICLYLCMKGRLLACSLAFICALVVHPTNMFLFPILLIPVLNQLIFKNRNETNRQKVFLISLLAVFLGLLMAFWVIQFVPQNLLDTEAMIERLRSPSEWLDVVVKFGHLLSGITVYQYIVGLTGETISGISSWLFFSVLFFLLIYAAPKLLKSRDFTTICLLSALTLSLFLVYIVSGFKALTPSTERYGMFLTVPACWIFSCLLFPDQQFRKGGFFRYLMCAALCFSLLFGFWREYYVKLKGFGGASEPTFRTSDEEPKLASWKLIREAVPQGDITICADSWWTYWPLKFLSQWDSQVQITTLKDRRLVDIKKFQHPVFLVGFEENVFHQSVDSQLEPMAQSVIKDSQGRPILHVWRVR